MRVPEMPREVLEGLRREFGAGPWRFDQGDVGRLEAVARRAWRRGAWDVTLIVLTMRAFLRTYTGELEVEAGAPGVSRGMGRFGG